MKKWLIAVVTGLSLLMMGPTAAFADEGLAKQLYKKAQTRYQNSQFEEAATLLAEAYAEDPKLIYQFNRIMALQGAGKYEKALEVLEEYEEEMLAAGGFEEIPEIKKTLRERIAKPDETEPKPTPDNMKEEPAKSPEVSKQTEAESSQLDETETETDTEQQISEPQTPNNTPEPNIKKVVGWSLVGVSGALYGTAAFLGSYLPYSPAVREKLRNGGPFTSEEIKAFKTNRSLTIGAVTLATATLVGGGWLLLSNSESPRTASVSVGLGSVSLGFRF
jgi:hypothetical protein